MTKLSDWLVRACTLSGLKIDVGYVAMINEKSSISTVARIQGLGGEKGMLVFGRLDDVREHAGEVVEAGYGYTVLDEPTDDEVFDLVSYQDMFKDWGWRGLGV